MEYVSARLSNLYIQHGAPTHDPEIKSCMLYQLSQRGTHISTLKREENVDTCCTTGEP